MRLGRLTGWSLAAIVTVLTAGAASAAAHPGDLDPGFGRGGLLILHSQDERGVADLALNPDGSATGAGFRGYTQCSRIDCIPNYRELLVGMTPDGHLERSFGGSGLLEPDSPLDPYSTGPLIAEAAGAIFTADARSIERFGPGGAGPEEISADGWVSDLQALPGGRLLVGANAGTSFLIQRRLHSGELDDTFGTGGSVTLKTGYQSTLTNLVLDPSGGFWALGESMDTEVSRSRLTVAHFRADGSPDPAFAGDGIATFDVKPPNDAYRVIGGAAAPGGELTAVVRGALSGTKAIRIRPDATIDQTYGDGGIAKPDGLAPSFTVGVVGLDHGRIGLIRSDGLAVMNADGTLDASFGDGGLAAPYGFRPIGGVATEGGALLYGGTIGVDLAVARFELQDDGQTDADADGITDAQDTCPRTYGGPRWGGCPRVKRTLALRYRRRKGNLHVKMEIRYGERCPVTRVRLSHRMGGRVRWRRSRRISIHEPDATFDVKHARGRFRASVPGVLVPPVGRCIGARSNVVRPRRR